MGDKIGLFFLFLGFLLVVVQKLHLFVFAAEISVQGLEFDLVEFFLKSGVFFAIHPFHILLKNVFGEIPVDGLNFVLIGEEFEDLPTNYAQNEIFLEDFLADGGSHCIILHNCDISSIFIHTKISQ